MNIKKGMNDYFNLTKSSFKASTNNYHLRMINHALNGFDYIKVNNFKRLNISHGYQLIDYLKKHTKNGNNSINKIIGYIKKIMRFYKLITSFDDLPLLPSDTMPFKRFYHDELSYIVSYVKNLNSSKNSLVYKTFVLLLLDSGLRLSEALNIKISDIDFLNDTIAIYSTKTNTFRYAPFSSFSKDSMIKLIKRDEAREYLFYNFLRNRKISKDDIKSFYKRLRKKLKLNSIHTHRFRKTFGSILVENGINIDDLQKLYNHSRLSTTMIYVQHDKKRPLQEYKKYNDWGIN